MLTPVCLLSHRPAQVTVKAVGNEGSDDKTMTINKFKVSRLSSSNSSICRPLMFATKQKLCISLSRLLNKSSPVDFRPPE
jgi:hypothetical protein